jgi:hypothetical protein
MVVRNPLHRAASRVLRRHPRMPEAAPTAANGVAIPELEDAVTTDTRCRRAMPGIRAVNPLGTGGAALPVHRHRR